VVDTEVKDERRRMLAADGEGCPRRALATRDGGHEDPKIDSMASPRVPLGGMSLSARCVHDGWRGAREEQRSGEEEKCTCDKEDKD
jgi:hypothetical protein